MNCDTNSIPLKRHIEGMLRASGSLTGLPIVEVEEGTHLEPGLSCNNSFMTFEDMLRGSIGVDTTCGRLAIRVKFIDSCEVKLGCANAQDETLLNQIFAYDSTSKTFALVLNQS